MLDQTLTIAAAEPGVSAFNDTEYPILPGESLAKSCNFTAGSFREH